MSVLQWFRQQATLFDAPKITPVCEHCKQPRSKVEHDREDLLAGYPEDYRSVEAAKRAVICCTPDSEWRCPKCDGMDILFTDYIGQTDPDTGYRDEGEIAACRECGWRGDAEDTQPGIQPWAELEAVREELETRRQLQAIEDEYERARRRAPQYREVA